MAPGFVRVFVLTAIFFVVPLTGLPSFAKASLVLISIILFLLRGSPSEILAVLSFFPLISLTMFLDPFWSVSAKIMVGSFFLALVGFFQLVRTLRQGFFLERRLDFFPLIFYVSCITVLLSLTFYQSDFQSADQFAYSLKFWALGALGFTVGFLGVFNGGPDFIRRFSDAFIGTAISAVILYSCLFAVHHWVVELKNVHLDYRLMAYPLGSSSVFALYLLLSLIFWTHQSETKSYQASVIYWVTTFGVGMTGSRTVTAMLLMFTVILTILDLMRSEKSRAFWRWVWTSIGLTSYFLVSYLVQISRDKLVGLERRQGLQDDPSLAITPGGGLLENQRLFFWNFYFEKFLESPIFGIGVVGTNADFRPHSLPLELLSGLGLVGAFAAIALPLYTIFLLTRQKSTMAVAHAFASILVVAIYVSVNQSLTFSFPILWLIWGAMHAQLLNQKASLSTERGIEGG